MPGPPHKITEQQACDKQCGGVGASARGLRGAEAAVGGAHIHVRGSGTRTVGGAAGERADVLAVAVLEGPRTRGSERRVALLSRHLLDRYHAAPARVRAPELRTGDAN